MAVPDPLRGCWLGHIPKRCGHPFIEDMGEKWTFCEDAQCDGKPVEWPPVDAKATQHLTPL